MSKQVATHGKQNIAPGFTRARSNLIERRSTLGLHLCVQREAAGPAVHPSAPALVRHLVESPGQPLDAATRSFMEPRFGYDLSQVRVHTDGRAAESAEALQADAYSAGRDVVFGENQYSPGTPGGQHLLAHELAHVVQQANGPVAGEPVGHGVSVSQPSDLFEQAAEVTAGQLSAAALAPEATRQVSSLPAPPFTSEQLVLQRQKKKPPQQQTAAQAAAQAKDKEKKAEAWDLVKLHVTPELLTKFQEIGRVVAVDAQQSILTTFEPYDDDISTPDQTFLQIFLQGAGNVPQGEFLGFLGGAGAQGLQSAIGAMLDTQSVGAVKERARIVPEDVLARNLTSDSPYYEQFEDGALADLQGEFDSWWQAFPHAHDDPGHIRFMANDLQQLARKNYGANSVLGAKARKDFQALIDRGLAPIRDELEDAQAAVRRKRTLRTAASIGAAVGLLGGGIIGGLAGGWAGAAIGGMIGGLAAGGLALGGAALFAPRAKARQPKPEATGPGDYPVPSPHPKDMLA